MAKGKHPEACREGRVLKAVAGRALVQVQPSAACSGCALGGACGGGGRKGPEELWARDPLGVRPGQLVALAVEPRREVEIACLIYLLPAISLVLGAALGHALAPLVGMSQALAAPGLALVAAALSLLLGRAYAGRRGDLVTVTAVVREDSNV